MLIKLKGIPVRSIPNRISVHARCVGSMERFVFYEEAKNAYAIIATSEGSLYANIMLQKGIVV